MQTIFWGFLFVFLDYSTDLNGVVIGFLPDFVGYILLLMGLREIGQLNDRFVSVRPWVVGAAVFSAVLYVLEMVSASVQMQLIGFLLGMIGVVLSLYISFQIVTGITELEAERDWYLRGQPLKTVWKYLAVLHGVAYLLNWIPVLNVMCFIAVVIVTICFLLFFYKTAALYRGYQTA